MVPLDHREFTNLFFTWADEISNFSSHSNISYNQIIEIKSLELEKEVSCPHKLMHYRVFYLSSWQLLG